MADRISIKNMVFYGYHGVFTAEKEMGQRFEVDVDLYPSSNEAEKADDIDLAVNYVDVYAQVKEIVEEREMNLLESLAAAIADAIMESHELERVVVRVRKPHAPLGGPVDYVEAEVTREATAEG
ncbi:MAG: dihydroneopterin aldolase [Bacillota bacterium]|nr:dihydroneopterin aldolase [Bacillota bacterium]